MRLSPGLELGRGDDVVLWWLSPQERRALLASSWEHTRAAFELATRILPGMSTSQQALSAAIARLVDPGIPVAISSKLTADVVGLVRPFTIGDVSRPSRAFAAAVEGQALRLPLLAADTAELAAATRALDARAGRELPWLTFTVDTRVDELERALTARRAATNTRHVHPRDRRG